MAVATDGKFVLTSDFSPMADQPTARDELVAGLEAGDRFQTLLGATGTGKTFTMATVIEQVQRPTLVMAHNKTLAAQLCSELRDFFPDNAVEYFVSYYDYYQPEAYVPSRDLFIDKDSAVNEEIDRLRHAATAALFTRRDVIVVASVSCIYGLGAPAAYEASHLMFAVGEETPRERVLEKLVNMMYRRNDTVLERSTFRVRGDTVELFPAYADSAYRIELFGDEIEKIERFDPLTGEHFGELQYVSLWPATHYATSRDTIERALGTIGAELTDRLAVLEGEGKLLEAQRLKQRTRYDMEMMRELGFTSGIENYSRHLDGRQPGDRPYCLLDYFPDDFLTIIDESHQSVPQIGAMHKGDRARKEVLVDYGFRLPSALDNRPQTFDEFLNDVDQVVFVSATPGQFERDYSSRIAEQIVRPTGVVDPQIEIRPTRNQVDDLMNEIKKRVDLDQRTLVTTLTKKQAEDLTEYLTEYGLKVRYLHSDVDTLERIEIIRDLRLGEFDVLVGVNLLREGLDMPEVALVGILDADKEGFLRGEVALLQTTGRAARNIHGTVIMYADRTTEAMKKTIEETDRRRAIQVTYNEEHGITPTTIAKRVGALSDMVPTGSKLPTRRAEKAAKDAELAKLSPDELHDKIAELEEQMLYEAEELHFERAAELRDEIKALEALL
jgi:excinuclease ABC subunit B